MPGPLHILPDTGRSTGVKSLHDGLNEVDEIFERLAARPVSPGIAYGVVIDGELALSRGLGTLRDGLDLRPDQDSVFRIASMTKSFTAAALLLLRDERLLRLDDPVQSWIPELAGLKPPTTDSPQITIEHLLTMSAGFPTDDPWGDRQQGLEFGRFQALLKDGVSLVWAPGTRFEYSNLGYAILGLVVTRAAERAYPEFVAGRLLAPLGMTSTTFMRDKVPTESLAIGYVRRDDEWLEEPIDPYGAFASMGGVFTSVRDLARWVAGFADAFPARDSPTEHPLSRASRREMQQIHRSFNPELTWRSAGAAPSLVSGGYGYGLFVSDHLRLGRIVGHGGGYPGYGSQMGWHPSSGIGVIALANARYAALLEPVREAIGVILTGQTPRIRHVRPWPKTVDAKTEVERLLDRWDDHAAHALFSMNVELDEPLPRRRTEFQRLRQVHGSLRPDPSVPPASNSPAHLAWWLRGERGRVRVEILLSPEVPPRVQKLTVTSVPESDASLQATGELLAGLLGQPGPSLPPSLRLASPADRTAIELAFRAAEARFGPVTLGERTAGDGVKTGTWPLTGERGELDLELELATPGGPVLKIALVPRMMSPPIDQI